MNGNDDSVISVSASAARQDAAVLAALKAYVKAMNTQIKVLTERVRSRMETDDIRSLEPKNGAGDRLAVISHAAGKRGVVVDHAAALAWCLKRYPDRVVQSIDPAFLARLVNPVLKGGAPGDHGVDTESGEVLDFITVTSGEPYITVATTEQADFLAQELLGQVPMRMILGN